MAQKIFTTFRAAVESFPLGEQNVGLFKPGRYSGFDTMDQSLSGGLSIEISHSGAINKTQSDGNQAPSYGSILMPTGIIIHDDETLNFNIQSNAGNLNPRIDWLICENEYQAVEGGTPAFYSIIQGPGDGTPPVIPDPTKQILLGTITIEPGSSSYTGLTYTPSLANLPGDLTYEQLTNIINNVVVFPDATNTLKGIAMLATFAELEAGVITNKIVTPFILGQLIANETRKGLSRKASNADINTGTDNDSFVTPLYLKQVFDVALQAVTNALTAANTYTDNQTTPDATETVKGKAMIADVSQVNNNSIHDKIVTPLSLNARRATNTIAGMALLATVAEIQARIDDQKIITPKRLYDAGIREAISTYGYAQSGTLVFPPFGYTMANLIGVITSMREVWYNGDVNGDDYTAVYYQINPTNIRILGASSEQDQSMVLNYLAIWRK
jgi:hypothetical protein